MTNHWDEFSKSLAEKSVPRRQTLRLLGAAMAGALLSPLGAGTALAAGRDPCKVFCKCRNKQQQNACLAACRACSGDTSRLCGSCASGYACTDLGFDFYNCGACGHVCDEPGPYEEGACIYGRCEYACVDGAADCGDGACTPLWADPNNCGACGNVCPAEAPYCDQGACSVCAPGLVLCGDSCVDLASDANNCGACGNICGGSTPNCSQGACVGGCQGSCPEGWCGGDGCGGECACPSGFVCVGDGLNMCVPGECPGGLTWCSGVCTNISFDTLNCGACGVVCGGGQTCSGGLCQYPF